jgi:hypothetical protein
MEFTYGATGADEYFVGSVTCAVSGLAILTNADAAFTLGFCMQRTTITGAAQPVKVHVGGVWWVAAADFADADTLMTLMAPTAASDNPADLINQAAGTPMALGLCIHIDVTATSGWIDLGQRGTPANA